MISFGSSSIPKDGGVGDAVLVAYRLRLVILDPPSVKVFYGMLHEPSKPLPFDAPQRVVRSVELLGFQGYSSSLHMLTVPAAMYGGTPIRGQSN